MFFVALPRQDYPPAAVVPYLKQRNAQPGYAYCPAKRGADRQPFLSADVFHFYIGITIVSNAEAVKAGIFYFQAAAENISGLKNKAIQTIFQRQIAAAIGADCDFAYAAARQIDAAGKTVFHNQLPDIGVITQINRQAAVFADFEFFYFRKMQLQPTVIRFRRNLQRMFFQVIGNQNHIDKRAPYMFDDFIAVLIPDYIAVCRIHVCFLPVAVLTDGIKIYAAFRQRQGIDKNFYCFASLCSYIGCIIHRKEKNMEKNEDWQKHIQIHHHPPVGTFTQPAGVIVRTLLQSANNNPTLALHRLMFYMNKAGKNLENAEQLELAKKKLEEIIKSRWH